MITDELMTKLRDVNAQLATLDQNYMVVREGLMVKATRLEKALTICNDHADKVQVCIDALK